MATLEHIATITTPYASTATKITKLMIVLRNIATLKNVYYEMVIAPSTIVDVKCS